MSQSRQKQKTISEAAKKLLEKLNEIYKRYKQLLEEKQKLIEEYNEKLLQIEAKITDMYAEAARILDELEQHGLSINEIKQVLSSIPDEFFRDVARIRRKKVDKKQLDQAIKKTYEELMEEKTTPVVIKALRKVQSSPSGITTSIARPPSSSSDRGKFICPLCGEEHDKETEQVTITICRPCQAFIETWLIPNNVFEKHGAEFLAKYRRLSEKIRRLGELERAYRNLVRYLRSRGIRVPKELLVAG